MTRDEWRIKIKEELATHPKYEPVTGARLQALLKVARASQKDAEPDELLGTSALWPDWKPNVTYAPGDLVNYNGDLYRVVWAHTSQVNWDPISGPSNFIKIADPAIAYPDWVQPYAHNPYQKGDKVTYNGKKWILEVVSSTYAPGVVAGQWREVT